MSASPMPVQIETVSCDLCLKEIPVSEAKNEEATDYVMYFCGLECYQRWVSQAENQGD